MVAKIRRNMATRNRAARRKGKKIRKLDRTGLNAAYSASARAWSTIFSMASALAVRLPELFSSAERVRKNSSVMFNAAKTARPTASLDGEPVDLRAVPLRTDGREHTLHVLLPELARDAGS